MVEHKTVDLQWLLDDFVGRVSAVDRAVVLSADGLLVGRSGSLSTEDGEHLSAVASGFQSLARGAARHFEAGGVRQTMVEMDHGFLFVIAAGRGACLAVLAAETADVGLVAYEMNILLKRVGGHMSAAPRGAGPVGSGPGVPGSGGPGTGGAQSGGPGFGLLDSGGLDSSGLDSGLLDSGSLDSGSLDSGGLDSGGLDSGGLGSGRATSGGVAGADMP